MRNVRLACFGLWILLLIAGCGGSGSGTGSPKAITISPQASSIRVGGSVTFSSFVKNYTDPVQWSVVGGAANGTINSAGVYTAPNTAGTYQVKVRAGTLEATASVTVTPPVAVSISNAPAPIMAPRSTFDFDSLVQNATNTSVRWSVLGDNGTISSNGLYRAPNSPGNYTIVVTSNEDPTKTAQVTVHVITNPNVRLTIEGKGEIVMALNGEKAPNHVANLVSLVNKKFYDGIIFHRYVANFVIQGGDPLTKTLPLTDPSIGTGGPGYTIPFETNDLKHLDLSIAMARSTGLDTAGSQFYFCLGAQPSLDGNYVVFGQTASGGDVVYQLRRGDKIVTAVTEVP